MTRIIALVVFAQFICLSQSAQTKRASDACPGSNNKTSTSKEYAYLSKRTGGDNDFSKPKYQSIYAKNTNSNANTPARRGKAIAKEERAVTPKKEKQTVPKVKEEKSNSSKVSSASEEEFIEETPSEKKTETSKPYDVIQTEKVIAPETKPEVTKEEGKTSSSKKSERASSKNGSTNNTDLTTTKAVKQKQQKKSKVKKLRLGKKCATDCPEF